MNRHASANDRDTPRRGNQRDIVPRPRDDVHDRGNDGERYHRRDDRNGGGHDRIEPPPRRRLSGSAAAEYAKAHLLDLTGQPCEAVSSLSRMQDGWRIVLEVVELERIPRTTDILASYQVDLDDEGELMGYERIHRYCRNDVNGES